MSTGHSGSGGLFAGVCRVIIGGFGIGSLFSQQQKQQLQQQHVMDFDLNNLGGIVDEIGDYTFLDDLATGMANGFTEAADEVIPVVTAGVAGAAAGGPIGAVGGIMGTVTEDILMEDDDVDDVTPPGVTPGVNDPKPPDVSGCDCCDKCGPVMPPEFDPSKDCPDEKVVLDTMNTFLGDINKKGDELDKKLCQTKTEKKANDILFATTLKKYEKRLANYIENCMNAPGKSEGGGCPKPTDTVGGCGCGKPEGGCGCTKPTDTAGGCGCKVPKQTPKKGPATCKKPAKPKKPPAKPKKATTKPKKTSSVSTSCAKKRKDDSKWVPPKKKPKEECAKPIPIPVAHYPPMAP